MEFCSWTLNRMRSFVRVGAVARSSSGLTTLEWLLIVAAVAGLAALAVVLVQNVVDETAEEIAGNSARETAAKVAADRITSDAVDAIVAVGVSNFDPDGDKFKGVISEHKSKCDRLNITYSDAELTSNWDPFTMTSVADSNALRAALISQSMKGCSIPG